MQGIEIPYSTPGPRYTPGNLRQYLSQRPFSGQQEADLLRLESQLRDEAHSNSRGVTAFPTPEQVAAGLVTNEGDNVEAGGLDAPNTDRPEGLTEAEMTKNMQCHICYSQLATVACLPCGESALLSHNES